MGAEQKGGLPSPQEDPNYIAYQAFLSSDEASQLDPASWLAFRGGQLIAQAATRDELFEKMGEEDDGPTMFTQVKPEPITLHGFFFDKEGGLHRGVPVVGIDEQGNETTIGLEWGTMIGYPLDDKKEE